MNEHHYEGFEYSAGELQSFLYARAAGLFSIKLKDGRIIHYSPDVPEGFYKWLNYHEIENIAASISQQKES